MKEKDLFLLYLDSIAVSYKAMVFLIEKYDKVKDLNELIKKEDEILKVVSEKHFNLIKSAILSKKHVKSAEILEKYNIKAVFYYNNDYPKSLLNLTNKPLILYYKGDKTLLNKNSIAIVGTRKPTNYGREVTKHFSSKLSKAGLVTVSGLAYGLDMEVAQSTLNVKGKTIAVLGGGLDKIYPSQNTFLAEQIVNSGGLLLSLYPPHRSPTKYSFLERNRIISGLSLGTIIIEAGESSGTLNTASHTIEQGRELFVVPANIFSEASKGSNRLIEELPETFTVSPERVLKVLNISNNNDTGYSKKEASISEEMKVIVNLLYEGEKDFETILEQTKFNSKSLISLLTMMEINGLIKKLPGNFYSL